LSGEVVARAGAGADHLGRRSTNRASLERSAPPGTGFDGGPEEGTGAPVHPAVRAECASGPGSWPPARSCPGACRPSGCRRCRSRTPAPVDVSYGLGIFKLDNLLGHNGAAIGYSTAMFYLPSVSQCATSPAHRRLVACRRVGHWPAALASERSLEFAGSLPHAAEALPHFSDRRS
jgi:hypothetical protein